MALSRTSSTVRLKSNDGLYYTVALQDKSEAQDGSVVIPEADSTTGASGTSDEYVALIGSDDQIYRWSIETLVQTNPETEEDETFVNHLITLSQDQGEPAIQGLDLLFDGDWLRVEVEIQETETGDLVPNLIVGEGEPVGLQLTANTRYKVSFDRTFCSARFEHSI